MKKWKKLSMAFGASMAVAAPLVIAVSCGGGNNPSAVNILVGKTQINDPGIQFASQFDKSTLGKVEGAPGSTHFLTANGDAFATKLATTFGTKNFPAAMTIASTSVAKEYNDRNALLKFKDPKYDAKGVAANKDAEEYNASIAGGKINDMIKAIEMQNGSFVVDGEFIIGLPSFTEAIAIIYNKGVFERLGLKVSYDKNASDNSVDWTKADLGITGSEEKILYARDLLKPNYLKLKTYINAHKSKSSGLEAALGSVTSGTESWAFTSKIGMVATLGQATHLDGKKMGNIPLPGQAAPAGDMTPDLAQTDLFANNITFTESGDDVTISDGKNAGYKVYKDAAELYLKDTKNYSKNNEMMEAFIGEKIAMMPQGSWQEGWINKEGAGKVKYGFLPLSMGLKAGQSPFINVGVVGHWQFANMEIAAGVSKADALAIQTKAVNFVYSLYLGEGKNVLKDSMGLLNPYDPSSKPDSVLHPLLADASSSLSNGNAIGWGVSYNKPGVGVEGFERNNVAYTQLVDKYAKNPTADNLKALLEKVKSIWNQ